MKIRIFLFILVLFINISPLSAAKNKANSFLIKANTTTTFMNYEYHSLAYEAAMKEDYENSFRIYQKIANKGDSRAEYNLGMMYMNGLGIEKKKMSAYKWLRRASKHGNEEAIQFFKQMNDRYEQKHEIKKPSKPSKPEVKEVVEPVKVKANITKPVPVVVKPKPKPVVVKKPEPKKEDSSLMYIIIGFMILMIAVAVFLIKRGNSSKVTKESAPQEGLKYKTQMFDITYAHIENYHAELLKQVNMSEYKEDKKKMQIYYMFLAGVIDYFCQLEKFTESEQRRIFNTHMGQIEGKENLTPITQMILEGQRDHSMYHFQAAGGISAKDWLENKSKAALSMLNQILQDKE